MNNSSSAGSAYDVVIVGGALAGAASALLLLQDRPGLRVLIVERSAELGRRVGEATVEVSAFFLTRVLGLTQHLNEQHLVKQGFRFWFANSQSATLEQASEIGARYLARVPAFLVDRAVLDQEVLRRALASGAELWRPAVVQQVELQPGGEQVVQVRMAEDVRSVRCRWVIDASGVAALLARQQKWWRPNEAHPTTSVWSRWSKVGDLDGPELARRYPEWGAACFGLRRTATNHLMGHGWWAWIIPLKDGDVSVGVVFDQRLVTWPAEGSLGQRLKEFLCQHPVGRELMAHAQWREGDVHWRKNLPYVSCQFAGDGFAIVGDAAGFIDPFYSPGLDWMSYTVVGAVHMILTQLSGVPCGELVAQRNRDLALCYDRWFDAVYRDKYHYLGDYDLMRLAFVLDLGFYYLGVASQPYMHGAATLRQPVFTNRLSFPFYHVMRMYNRRLARIARARRRRGVWGMHNAGRRFMFSGFTFQRASSWPLVKALVAWGALELVEGWRSWFGHGEPAGKTFAAPHEAVPAAPPAG